MYHVELVTSRGCVLKEWTVASLNELLILSYPFAMCYTPYVSIGVRVNDVEVDHPMLFCGLMIASGEFEASRYSAKGKMLGKYVYYNGIVTTKSDILEGEVTGVPTSLVDMCYEGCE